MAQIKRPLSRWGDRSVIRKPNLKFAYLTMESSSFTRLVRTFFRFRTFHSRSSAIYDVKWSKVWSNVNDLSTVVDNVKFFWFLSPSPLCKLNFLIVYKRFATKRTWNNWEIILETRSFHMTPLAVLYADCSRLASLICRLGFWSRSTIETSSPLTLKTVWSARQRTVLPRPLSLAQFLSKANNF